MVGLISTGPTLSSLKFGLAFKWLSLQWILAVYIVLHVNKLHHCELYLSFSHPSTILSNLLGFQPWLKFPAQSNILVISVHHLSWILAPCCYACWYFYNGLSLPERQAMVMWPPCWNVTQSPSNWTDGNKQVSKACNCSRVVDFLMIVSWLSQDCLMTVSWLSHDCLMIVSWLSYDSLRVVSGLFHDCVMTVSWISHEFFMIFLRFFSQEFLNKKNLTFSWLSHDFLTTFSWLSQYLLTTFIQISHDFLLAFSQLFALLCYDFLMALLWSSHKKISWPVHDFLMTVSWLSYNCLMTFSWPYHGFLLTFFWLYHDFLMTFSWLSHDFLVTFFWTSFSCLSDDFLLNFSWLSHEWQMTFSWISHKLLMTFSWFFQDLIMGFSWLFHDFLLKLLKCLNKQWFVPNRPLLLTKCWSMFHQLASYFVGKRKYSKGHSILDILEVNFVLAHFGQPLGNFSICPKFIYLPYI